MTLIYYVYSVVVYTECWVRQESFRRAVQKPYEIISLLVLLGFCSELVHCVPLDEGFRMMFVSFGLVDAAEVLHVSVHDKRES